MVIDKEKKLLVWPENSLSFRMKAGRTLKSGLKYRADNELRLSIIYNAFKDYYLNPITPKKSAYLSGV